MKTKLLNIPVYEKIFLIVIFGILGTATIAIGIVTLFTLQQNLDLYCLAEKQLQFS